MLERVQRAWNFHPASYPLRSLMASLSGVAGGPRPVRMLLASDGRGYTSEQQFAPLRRHARLLRQRLGLVVQHRPLDEVLGAGSSLLSGFDIVGIKMTFQRPRDEAESVVARLRQALAGRSTRLVYFDGDDDPNIQWHGVIQGVDLYVKKHTFADPAAYGRTYVGKSNLTDYAAREFGVSFAQDVIPASGGLPAQALSNLHLGWNVALDDKIVALAAAVDAMPHPVRDIDMSCRAYVKPEVWTHGFRNGLVERMEALASRHAVLAPRDRVPQEKYYEEMLRSRICVSPFGFGEICWRDFEAILCGCLLVKPDMGHVRTLPDVFVPGQTYVPVRWDYADLEQVCARYLADDAERERIAANARRALLDSLQPAWFVDRCAEMLTRLGLGPRAAAS